MNANLRNFALWVIIVLLLLALFTLFQNPGQRSPSQDISFSQLLTEVDKNTVRDVVIQGPEIQDIIDLAKAMVKAPVQLLDRVEEVIESLSDSYTLMLITKGDLFDQERKLAQSGLGDFFHAVEIVSDKTAVTYRRIFSKVGGGPERAMMVGNSLKSDIVPAIAAGSYGVFVPHELTWVVEHVEEPKDAPRFRKIEHLGELRGLIEGLG